MKSVFSLLLISLVFYTVPVQAQLSTVQNIELPLAYETWQGGTEQLNLRTGLIAEKERRGLVGNHPDTGILLRISRINSEIVNVVMIENNNQQVMLTLYWRTIDGYIKLSTEIGINPTKELDDQVEDTWQAWDKYMREKYNINDQEMNELERFLEL